MNSNTMFLTLYIYTAGQKPSSRVKHDDAFGWGLTMWVARPTYRRVLGSTSHWCIHVGLRYVSAQSGTREEGKAIIFDDSWEHEVIHTGTDIRVVLIMDIWHPELPESRRIVH